MKIVFISFYSGIAQRGGETYVHELANRLAKKHQVTVFQAGKNSTQSNYQTEIIPLKFDSNHPHGKLPVTHFLKRLFLDYNHLQEFIFTVKLVPKLFRNPPDFIFPQNAGWEVVIVKFFSLFFKSKIIISGQSGLGWNDRVNLFCRPDYFIALTRFQADWAKKATIWKNQKIIVIPNGVDLAKFKLVGIKYRHDLIRPVILAVGAAVPSKRIIDTIKSVAVLPKASLLVVGTGPQETQEDKLANQLLGSKRYRRLKVTNQNMPSIYRSADIFTLCSDHSEAFGICYLEAQASGLPIVATDDATRREVVGDRGFFVSHPENSLEYAKVLKQAIGHVGHKTVSPSILQYNWDNIAGKYLGIINK